MLLGYVLLSARQGDPVAAYAASYWLARERVEVEAASVLLSLARDLQHVGAPETIADLAREAHHDELRHADQCRAIVNTLRDGPAPDVPRAIHPLRLAPGVALDPHHAALYAAVAIGCVTETLSAALLVTIQERATHELVQATAHAILRDEVQHSRLGWAYLAFCAEREDVTWLSVHVQAMLDAALQQECEPLETGLQTGSLEPWGVLSTDIADEVCRAAIRDVIRPGFAHFGVMLTSDL